MKLITDRDDLSVIRLHFPSNISISEFYRALYRWECFNAELAIHIAAQEQKLFTENRGSIGFQKYNEYVRDLLSNPRHRPSYIIRNTKYEPSVLSAKPENSFVLFLAVSILILPKVISLVEEITKAKTEKVKSETAETELKTAQTNSSTEKIKLARTLIDNKEELYELLSTLQLSNEQSQNLVFERPNKQLRKIIESGFRLDLPDSFESDVKPPSEVNPLKQFGAIKKEVDKRFKEDMKKETYKSALEQYSDFLGQDKEIRLIRFQPRKDVWGEDTPRWK